MTDPQFDPWQSFDPTPDAGPPFAGRYPARMPDGGWLHLPVRPIGVAGLIATQASFSVVHALTRWMADVAAPLRPEVILGLPLLGHVFAPLLAERLGHSNWVAAGYSQKLWYEKRLSVPMRSITTTAERRLWLDPRMLPRLAGRRVLLVDDVISTGSSARAGLALLEAAGLRPVGLCVAMIQTRRWQADWQATIPVVTVCETPLLARGVGGWTPIPG